MSAAYTNADVEALLEFWHTTEHSKPETGARIPLDEAAVAFLDDLAPAIAARALREFATNRVTHQTPARLIEDMFDRADEIEADR